MDSPCEIYLIVCKNPKALAVLIEESVLLGHKARDGKRMSQGDALAGRDILEDAGFRFTKDFYLKKDNH